MKFFRLFLTITFITLFLSPPVLTSHAQNPLAKSTKNITSTLEKPTFTTQDNPQIEITANPPSQNIFTRLISIFRQNQNTNLKENTQIILKDFRQTSVDSQAIILNTLPDGNLSVDIDKNYLKPGKYTLEITDTQSNQTITQDFTWGVLAFNSDKSFYLPGETAILTFAVLNEQGAMVCDAKLDFIITSPDGTKSTLSTSDKTITISPTCDSTDANIDPDYSATIQLAQTGTHPVTITATTKNGTYLVTDSIKVETDLPFEVQRITSTRIYPVNIYPVSLVITATSDFKGIVTETVPSSFSLTFPSIGIQPLPIDTKDNRKIISWPVNLKSGQTITLKYSYDAPNISPEFYTLGPLSFTQKDQILFTESRSWQIANDAANDIILLWDTANGSIPSGWTCISCTSGDPFYGVIPMASSSYSSTTAGSDTHNSHTLTFSVQGVGVSNNLRGSAGTVAVAIDHSHTWTGAITGNGSVLPPYQHLNFIYASNPSSLPSNTIGVFDTTSLPSGWTRYSGLDGLYLRGFSDNATGGSATHNHSVSVTSGNTTNTINDSGSGSAGSSTHTHTLSGNTENANNEPPFVNVVFAYNSSGLDANIPNGLIAFFDATPPSNWNTISNSAPYNGKFLKGASSDIGTTGGSAASHNHTGTVTITSAGGGSNSNNRGTTGTLIGSPNPHTHDVTYDIGSTDSLPVHRNVIMAKYTPPANQAPTAPTLVWIESTTSPVTGIIDTTPEFSAIYNDPDSGDIANKYRIQVDDDSGFGSPIWDVGATGATMSNCTAGNRCSDVSYAGSALTRGTVYYVRIKFWDDDNTEGAWSAGTDNFRLNRLPDTPTNSTPGVGVTGVSRTPTLTASAFSDADSDSQSASQWQISTGTGGAFAGGIVFDTGTTGPANNSLSVGYTLSYNTQYYFRVRYQDDKTEWSNYSTDTGFTTLVNSPPNTPTNTTPGVGATGVSFTPTLTASAFSDPNAGDTQANSQWQVATDSGFSNIVFDTGTTGPASNSTSVTTTLSVGTTYYWHVRYKDNYNNWSNYSTGTMFVTNRAPVTPTNTTPGVGATNVPVTPTLTASSYSDPDGNAQANSQWQVATDSGFSNIVFDTGTTGPASNSTSVTTTLNNSSVYYWRVRYKDNQNNWSSYSSNTSFTTVAAANNNPNTPSNTTPGVGATGVSRTPTLIASTFSDPDGGDTHAASQWQVATDSGFSNIIFDTGTTGPASNTVNVTTTLDYNTQYYFKVRYQDNRGGWSNYSSGTNFTTLTQPTPTPTQVPLSTRKIYSHYWKFDENRGNSANSQNGVSASRAGTTPPSWTLNGKLNTALSFDGSTSQLNINSLEGLDFGSSAFSLSAWVYPTSTSGIRSIFSSTSYIFYIEDGQLKFQKSSASWDTIAGGTIPVNQWTHVAFTRSGIGANETKLYINGSLAQTGAIATLNSASNPAIGYQSGNGRYFAGTIDEVKVYAYSLSPDTIKVEYNSGAERVLGGTNSYSSQYCVPGSTDPCSAPVAEWKFDEGVGTTAYDTSSNIYHGIFGTGSSAPSWTRGKIGKALLFDGSVGKYVSANAGSGNSNNFTVEAWIYPTNYTGAGNNNDRNCILLGNSKYFQLHSNGTLAVYIQGLTTPGYHYSTSTIPLNKWSFVSYSWNGSNINIYINGKLDAVIPNSGTPTSGWNSITIGYENPSYERQFDGKIDQVRIFGYARTPAQIAYDYNRGGPVGWWKMDECQGTTIADWSGNANHGTLSIGASGTQTSPGNCTTVNTATAWYNGRFGKTNSSLNFDGSDDILLVGDPANGSLDFGTGPFSYGTWIYSPSSAGSFDMPISKGGSSAGNPGYDMELGTSSWTANVSDGTNIYTVNLGSETLNQWIHLFVVIDRQNNQLRGYKNGILTNTTNISTLGSTDSANPLYISHNTYRFKGQIDDVRIYNYALTPEQIKQVYNNGAVNFR